MAQARELPAGVERDRFVVAAAAERIGASIDALSKLKAGPGELETSKAFFKTTITSLADALVGVTRNGINHPEALSAIQSRVGALRSMTSKISGASPLRMEFADMLDKYARPGGIKAWSDLVGAERQYGDALLFKSSAERSADIASTKNFIEQFAEDRSDSATLTALSADVKSDTWAANGFEPDQGAALGRALVQRAARNKLDEQYLDACARGDIELASSMISRGADPEAVDPKGRQAGALCMLGPNRGAAKVLESLVDKTVTARALARLRSTGEFALSF
jgi:hypothetical protein